MLVSNISKKKILLFRKPFLIIKCFPVYLHSLQTIIFEAISGTFKTFFLNVCSRVKMELESRPLNAA